MVCLTIWLWKAAKIAAVFFGGMLFMYKALDPRGKHWDWLP